MSVTLCVCLSARISPEPHARCLPIFVHVAYGRNSVVLRQGDVIPIPRGKGQFGGFLPHWQCIVQHSNGTNTKIDEPIEMPFGMMSGLGRRNNVLRGGDYPLKGAILGKHVSDKTNTPMNCELELNNAVAGTRQGQTLSLPLQLFSILHH